MRLRALSALVCGVGLLGLSLLVSLTPADAARGSISATASPVCPSFSASNFHRSTRIDNPYFPLTPGDLYTYNGNLKKQPEVDKMYVTHNTPTIAGVRTVEVLDRVYLAGTLSEQTLDWYAQDDKGNVWYFGEFTTEYPDG